MQQRQRGRELALLEQRVCKRGRELPLSRVCQRGKEAERQRGREA